MTLSKKQQWELYLKYNPDVKKQMEEHDRKAMEAIREELTHEQNRRD